MRVLVLHSFYGCETGCCGHEIEVDGEAVGAFDFSHPYNQSRREFAEQLVRDELGEEHVKDLDWENCIVLDD